MSLRDLSVSTCPLTPLGLQICATTPSSSHGVMDMILINCQVSFELTEKLALETGLPPPIPDPRLLVLESPLRHLVQEWAVPPWTITGKRTVKHLKSKNTVSLRNARKQITSKRCSYSWVHDRNDAYSGKREAGHSAVGCSPRESSISSSDFPKHLFDIT